MKKLVASVLVIVFALALCVSAFAENETITVFNWYDYIDEDVLEQFTEETGIEIKYVCFTTNEEMYAKLSVGAGSYDVIFPSDYIIERMISEDQLAEINYDNVPNAAGLLEGLQNPDYDPGNKYSVPYMWGTVGILYNTDYVDEEITSWDSLFDVKYKRDVFMIDSIRDSIGITLKKLGYSLNTRDEAALQEVKEVLLQQKADGIVKGYLVDETKDKMIAGEAALAVVWSGDALYAISEADNLAYVVPDEGSNIWVDGVCILKDSQHKEASEKFIDFLCRPDIATKNEEYIHYYTPIQSVVDAMSEEDKNDPTLNPTQDIIDRCEFFHDIQDDIDMYDRIWMEIRS